MTTIRSRSIPNHLHHLCSLNSASNVLRCLLVMFPVQVDSTYAVSVEIRPAQRRLSIAEVECQKMGCARSAPACLTGRVEHLRLQIRPDSIQLRRDDKRFVSGDLEALRQWQRLLMHGQDEIMHIATNADHVN